MKKPGASNSRLATIHGKLQTMDGGFSVSPLLAAAMQLHETYLELRKAGFTQDEALTLIAKMSKES